MMSVPVMSLGIRSGVNWMRLNTRPRVCAMVRTSSVLAVPGRPVIRQWPPTNRRDHHLLQHLLLAHDHAAHLRHNFGLHLAEALDARLQNLGFQLLRHGCRHVVFQSYFFVAAVFLAFRAAQLQQQLLRRPESGRDLQRRQTTSSSAWSGW